MGSIGVGWAVPTDKTDTEQAIHSIFIDSTVRYANANPSKIIRNREPLPWRIAELTSASSSPKINLIEPIIGFWAMPTLRD